MNGLPEREPVWTTNSRGIDVFSHWNVPRADLGELLHKWKGSDLLASDQVEKDIRKYRYWNTPMDECPAYEGELAPYEPLFAHQDKAVRIDPRRLRMGNMFNTGDGKCLGLNTPIVMFDGTIKKVQDVVVGDLLMGPDSKSRTVVSLARGQERLYKIKPLRGGDDFVCNESHMLSLKRTQTGEVVNLSVKSYLAKDAKFKHLYKLYRAECISFNQSTPCPIDPYFLGLWLGDGSSRDVEISKPDQEIKDYLVSFAQYHGLKMLQVKDAAGKCPRYALSGGGGWLRQLLRSCNLLNNKHIPHIYMTASVSDRLQLLAGLLDSDGHYYHGGYEITQKSKTVADQIAFLARSLGFAVLLRNKQSTWTHNGVRKQGTYYRISINGHLDQIPCKIERKKSAPRQQKKNHLITGFSTEDIGVGDYYGFELSGPDRLFLLGDFTVTHNTRAALERVKMFGHERILILTIGTVLDDWEEDVQKVFGQDVFVYGGSKQKRAKQLQELSNHQVVMSTYECGHEIHEAAKFDHYIFDEADEIANPTTQRAKKYVPMIDYTLEGHGIGFQVLTATPNGNQPESVWNLLYMIHPFIAGSLRAFRERYQEVEETITRPHEYTLPDGRKVWGQIEVVTKVKPINMDKLRDKMACAFVSANDAEGKNYDEKVDIVKCTMTDEQWRVYKELKKECTAMISERRIDVKQAKTMILRLLQAAEGLFNLEPGVIESGKLDYLVHLLKKAQRKGVKVIVWSRFKAITRLLWERFQDCAVLYNGDLNKDQKLLSKWAFCGVKSEKQRAIYERLAKKYSCTFAPGAALFFFSVIHTKTSRGMNLQKCAFQIFSSMSLSGRANRQTYGRIARIGQMSRTIRTLFLVCARTAEEQILQYVLEKIKEAKVTATGEESLKKDQVVKLLKIIKYAA